MFWPWRLWLVDNPNLDASWDSLTAALLQNMKPGKSLRGLHTPVYLSRLKLHNMIEIGSDL